MLISPEQLQSLQRKLSTGRLYEKDTGDIPENASVASGSILSIDSVDSSFESFTVGELRKYTGHHYIFKLSSSKKTDY